MKFFETSKYYTLKKSTYIFLRWIGIFGQLHPEIAQERDLPNETYIFKLKILC